MTNVNLSTPLGAAALLVACLVPSAASAQLLTQGPLTRPPPPCVGKVKLVKDTTFEATRSTGFSYFGPGGTGGLGGFDPVPVLSDIVDLRSGCLNAHLSAMVGSSASYNVSRITLFQVTLTSQTSGTVYPMNGHNPWCYRSGPCVALSAEYDVDMLGANFYKGVGSGPYQVPPDQYRVDVWWVGGPSYLGGAGAIGAAFVLKLYQG